MEDADENEVDNEGVFAAVSIRCYMRGGQKEMGGRGGVEKGSVEEKRGCGHTEAEDDSTDGSEEKREGDTSCYRVRAIIRSQGSG